MTTRVALEDVADIIMGQAPEGSAYNDRGEGWPLIAGAGDFKGDRPRAKKFTTSASKLSRSGDIVIGIRASIGAKVWSDGEYCLGRGVAALRARAGLDSHFLWHWITAARGELESKGRGATFLQVNRSDIAQLRIPLPPLPEQRRIASILDQADNLRTKRREAIESLRHLGESLFDDMFRSGHKGRVVPLSTLAASDKGAIRTGPFGSQLLHSEFVDRGIKVLGIDNAVTNEFQTGKPRFISEAKYEQLRRYTVKPGDVLITIMGTVGRCAVVPDDVGVAINTKHLCCITLDQSRCRPRFLQQYFLRHPTAKNYLRSKSKGAIMDGLNMTVISEIPVELPSIERQAAFVSSFAEITEAKQLHLAHLAKLDELFASLQRRAFAAEL